MRVLIRSVVAVIALAANNAAFSAGYYIAKSGSDSNAGTKERPWATIHKANSVLRAGDTVYIRDGEYSQVIKPSRSGAERNYITYRAYPGETPVLTNISSDNRTAIVLDGRSYIRIDGIKVTGKASGQSANLKSWISMNDSHYNVIQNSDFRYAAGWSAIYLDGGSHHNKFINNRMDDVGTWHDGKGDMVSVNCANFNLFQGNHLTKAGHNLLDVSGSFNVIRNNIFDNKWGAGKGYRSLDLSGNFKFCSAGPNGYTLFENNIVRNTLPNPNHAEPEAMKVQGTNQIIRGNLILNNIGPAIKTEVRDSYNIRRSWKNKIYNNVFYDNGSIWLARDYGNTRPAHSNVFKNNVFMDTKSSVVAFANLQASGSASGYDSLANTQFHSNTFGYAGREKTLEFKGAGNRSIEWYQSNKPANFKNNLFQDPGFAADKPWDLEGLALKPGSALIDRGEMLTFAVSAGSGTSISVADAGYFTNGFEVIEGDTVKIGENAPVGVVGVDYDRDVLQLSRALSWNDGDGVSLAYSGDGPDIGAREFGDASVAPPEAPKNIRIEFVSE